MASAKTTTVVTVKEVVLTLSAEEAATLREVCRHVAGNARTSKRRHTDSIDDALDSAGIVPTYDATGSGIYFDC